MVALVASVACLLGCAACSGDSGKKSTVRFAALPNSIFALPLYVAQDQGYFEAHGVEGDITSVNGGGAQLLAALGGGSVDLTWASVEQVALSNQNGNPLRIVVGNNTRQPWALVVRNGLDKPKAGTPYPDVVHDLKGARIGVSTVGSASYLTLAALLKSAGMDIKDVTPVQTNNQPVPLLQANQVDAVLDGEPSVCIMTTDLKLGQTVLDYRKPGSLPTEVQDVAFQGWVVPEKKSHDKKITEAAEAISDAINFIRDPANVEKVKEIAAKHLGTTKPDVLDCEIKAQADSFNSSFDPAVVTRTLDGLNLKAPQAVSDIITGIAAQADGTK